MKTLTRVLILFLVLPATVSHAVTTDGERARLLYQALVDIPETPAFGQHFKYAIVDCHRRRITDRFEDRCEVKDIDGHASLYDDSRATELYVRLPLDPLAPDGQTLEKRAEVSCNRTSQEEHSCSVKRLETAG